MRRAASQFAPFGLVLGLVVGAGACFEDPLTCVQCMSDGDESGGDGDSEETVVLDLFTKACGLTATWSSHTSDPVAITCDDKGAPETGWMVRYPGLTIGGETFTKVVAIVPPASVGGQVRGLYNLGDIPGADQLEFRAEVLLRCGGDTPAPICVGRFGVAIAEGVTNGLFSVVDDRNLMSGMAPVSIATPLNGLITLSEPSVVLFGEHTDTMDDTPPELLIINPRLVSP